MRKLLILGLLLAALMGVCLTAGAETAAYGRFTADTDAAYIDLGDTYVKDYKEFMAFLDQFPNLERVDMYTTQIKKADIEALAERYPRVKFGWTMVITASDHKHFIRTDATAFSTLHNNQSRQHRSADFSILKYCTELLALDIGHNSVDDLSFLYDLPNLRVLIIACNQVQDITPLASLKHLEYAEIFKNKISDLTPLAELTSLIDLNICFNKVKDWTPLHGLTNVQRLWLYNSNNYSDNDPVPRDAVNALKEALPDAYVDAKSYSTNGGWREHPRYDVIYQMFKTGVYIPFAESAPLEEAEMPAQGPSVVTVQSVP